MSGGPAAPAGEVTAGEATAGEVTVGGRAPTPRRRAVKFVLTVLPFAGAAAILTLLLRRVPVERLLAAFAEADPGRFLLALLPVSVVYVALDTGLLRQVLGWFHPPRLPPREVLSLRAVDYLVSLWNGRASQAALLGAMGRRFTSGGRPDSGYLECAGTILFLDLCQRLHLLAWAGAGAAALGSAAPERAPTAVAIAGVGLCLLAVFLRGRLRAGGARLGPPRWRILRAFRRAGARRYLAVLAWKAPALLAAAAGHHFALRAFGVEVSFGSLTATLPLIFLAGTLPIGIARLGATQAAWIYFHAEAAAASPGGEAGLLAYALTAHLTFLLANVALSAPFLPRAWRSLRLGKHAAAPPDTEADTEAKDAAPAPSARA